ncbi:FCPF [Symbiodinium sp. CCMP2592]|nr:FCPF [Symbiodinium sp. CCMP2592]
MDAAPAPPAPPQLPGMPAAAPAAAMEPWDVPGLVKQVITIVVTLAVVAIVRAVHKWMNSQSSSAVTSKPPPAPASTNSPAPPAKATPQADDGGAQSKSLPGDAQESGKGAASPTGAQSQTEPQKEAKGSPEALSNTTSQSVPASSTDPAKQGVTKGVTDITDAKDKSAPTATSSPPARPSPEALFAALQGCQKEIKNLQATLSKQVEDVAAEQQNLKTLVDKQFAEASSFQTAAMAHLDELATVVGQIKQIKHDVVAVNGDVKLISQRTTGIEGILGILMPQVKTLVSSVGTLSSNVESIRQMTDAHWKEVVKQIGATVQTMKNQHTQWEQTTDKNQQYLVDGVKEVIKKVTSCDYDSFTALSKQMDQLGQELLASAGYLQTETSTLKDGLYNLVVALGNTSEQVATVKEYCERPPVPLMSSAPPPPSYEAPTVIAQAHPGDRRQLHLQTAIPQAQVPPPQAGPHGGQASVYVDLGEGRRVNIPLFR